MAIPEQFLPAVHSGQVVRYGCILKDVTTGQIVGHLKELAGLSRRLSGIPIHPLLTGAATVAQAGQWIDTHMQLGQIRQALDHLQLVSSVGAVASVVGLGVSVAGFAIVWKRLQRLEQNLNRAMDQLGAEVQSLHLKIDLLSMAELTMASQQLDSAGHTDRPEREAELLKDADRCFQKYRNYYYRLILELEPLTRPALTLPQIRELYGRFFVCVQGELEATFLLHDLAQWRHRHEGIIQQLAQICDLDAQTMLRCRVDALGLITQSELDNLKEQVLVTRDLCRESQARFVTAQEEVLWLDRNRLAPSDYLHALQNAPSKDGIVLFPRTLESSSPLGRTQDSLGGRRSNGGSERRTMRR